MSLNSDVFRKRPILGNRILAPVRDHYYPQDYYESPVEPKEGSAKYASWTRFKEKYPFNAKLLTHLFGERDAIECHRSMIVVSELKAASMCSFFSTQKFEKTRIQSMGDC